MLVKKKLFISLVALGLVGIVGAIAGLGLAGAFDLDDSSPARVTRPATTSGSLAAPDLDFREELRRAGISTRGWETDFSRHSVPYREISSGGVPRDGIPPLDDPKFITPEQADQWLGIVQQYPDGFFKIAKSDWEDAHERAVTVAVFIGQPSLLWFNSLAQAVDSLECGSTDVEYLFPGSPVGLVNPAYEQATEVPGIALLHQALYCT